MTKKWWFYPLHFAVTVVIVGLYALISNQFFGGSKDWIDVFGTAGLATLISLTINHFRKN